MGDSVTTHHWNAGRPHPDITGSGYSAVELITDEARYTWAMEALAIRRALMGLVRRLHLQCPWPGPNLSVGHVRIDYPFVTFVSPWNASTVGSWCVPILYHPSFTYTKPWSRQVISLCVRLVQFVIAGHGCELRRSLELGL